MLKEALFLFFSSSFFSGLRQIRLLSAAVVFTAEVQEK